MSSLLRCLALAGLIVLALPATAAQLAQPAIYASVIESGRYRLEKLRERQFAAETTAGYSSVVEAALLEAGHRVPVRLGEAFGLRFAISDLTRNGEWIPVEVHISHPPIPDHRGELRTGFVMQSAARRGRDGQYYNAAYYILSEPRELAAGTWEIAVVYRGQRLLSQSFELVAAPAAADAARTGNAEI